MDGIPSNLPGTVSKPQHLLEQRLTDLENRVAELSRRDLTNAVVGEGGTFRATLEAGGTDVLRIGPGNPVFGPKQKLELRDIANSVTYGLDELAGYGLSAPIFTYFMGSLVGAGSTAGVEAVFAESQPFVYNPAWYVSALIRNMSGAATSWSVAFKVSAPSLPTLTSSALTFTGGATFLQKVILMPKEYINAQNVSGRIVATPNGTGNMDVWPIASAGRSKSFYDIFTGLH